MPISVSNRLTRDERMTIYQWSGEGYTAQEIVRMFNRLRPGLGRVRIMGVEKILSMPEAHKFVAKFRINFLKSIKEIPISQKVVRLDDLERLRQRLMHIIINCNPGRGEKEVHKLLSVSKRLIEITELARNEMDQRPGLSIGIGINQGELNELSDEQLRLERDELLRRATNTFKRSVTAFNEIAEGDEGSDREGGAEIFLASSEGLRREKLQKCDVDIQDVRQQDNNGEGLPAV